MTSIARVLLAAGLVTSNAFAGRPETGSRHAGAGRPEPGVGQAASAAPAPMFDALANDYWEWQLRESPETATLVGDARYNDRLADLSWAAVERRRADVRAFLERFRKIDRTTLTGQNALSASVLEWELTTSVAGQRFPTEVLVLDQLDGPHLLFPSLVQATPFRQASDYDAYLKRLQAWPHQLEQIQALLQRGIDLVWVQPNGPLRGVPEQIRGQITDDPAKSPFFTPFLAMPAAVTADGQTRLKAAATRTITSAVYPALRRFHDFVKNVYLPRGARPTAAAALPDGAAFYTWRVRRYTTTALGADAIHRLGLSEVERIRKEMDAVVQQSGFTGSFAEFLTFLRTDPRFYFTEPDALVTAYRDIAKRADAELPNQFRELPRSQYGVRPFPDYEAPSQTTARYYPGAGDGSRAGYFMVNTWQLAMRPKYEMEALTLHEAVPGHHLQIARAQELPGIPAFRRNLLSLDAFIEGWALYAESLGTSMGFYKDPYQRFGQLTYEMWRACRLVVDTGLHQLGWTRDQAIAFMKDHTAKAEHDIEVEVDRYIVWPGQALAYKIGELKIKELRAKAEKQLGSRFDVRAFHNAVLDNGALPLELLEREIDRWIDSKVK
jgi:uncharacterized protein (DUF885 family)